MSDVYILDASALLAALHDEPGADRVRELLPLARMSSVNLAEAVAKLRDYRVPEEIIDAVLYDLGLIVVPFTMITAKQAGLLRGVTRDAELSLGDRACLALAAEQNAIAVTTDPAWSDLGLDVSIEVVC